MLLTVDVGNSQTVLATFDGERRVGCWRVTTAPRATADELRLLWRGLLRDTEITGVAACSTVPAAAAGAARAAGLPRGARRPHRAGRAHRRPAARRQPPRGRRRPRRDRAGRARAVRALARRPRPAGGRRRLRHLHQRRRHRARTGSSSAARSPRASRSAWTRWPPARPSCARSSSPCPPHAIGKNTVAAPAVRAGPRLRRPGRRARGADRGRDRGASSAPRRSSSPPAGWPRWWSTAAGRSASGNPT